MTSHSVVLSLIPVTVPYLEQASLNVLRENVPEACDGDGEGAPQTLGSDASLSGLH